MNTNEIDGIGHINYLFSEMQALYHQASLRLGITDSVSVVLYTIHVSGEDCLLRDVYRLSGVSKQTVNSAIRRLEADGALRLEADTGRSKRIILTEAGRALIQRTVARLYDAEVQAFSGWTPEEIETYTGLMSRYADCLRQQIERL